MADDQRVVAILVEQANISFYDYSVVAVGLSDGKIGLLNHLMLRRRA